MCRGVDFPLNSECVLVIIKIEPLLKYFLYSGIICSLIGCSYCGRVIDLKTIAPLTVIEKKDQNNEDILGLSGLVFDSAMSVDEVRVQQKSNELNILVVVKLGGRTKTGRLEYRVTIPPNVVLITFGENRETLWSRETGVISSPSIK